ncbi:family 78 glycoside hydrolase catalytic domain [Paenibacillus sp. J5C_2022]|nr:family 78 glycoside hydrolase catalytic domain [Paenibacillus sp. J5C2022]
MTDWKARWIWSSGEPVTLMEGKHEIVYFRRSFNVSDIGSARLVCRITADSRYRLYVNGMSASVGPCKGDRYTHYYETVDLSTFLVAGLNTLAVKVVHYTLCEPFRLGVGGPASVWRSNQGAFLFEGSLTQQNGCATISLSSDEQWECLIDDAIVFEAGEQETLYVGGTERVIGRKLPFGWQMRKDTAMGWKPAVMVSDVMDMMFGQLTPWPLVPRTIPPLYEQERGFAGIKRISAAGANPIFHQLSEHDDSQGRIVQPGERFEVELDAGELLTGYLVLELSGGKDADIEILCSECYEKEPESTIRRNKDIRDDPEGRRLYGEKDKYIAAGIGDAETGEWERYEPFEFRTFRFVKLTAQAKEEELRLHRFYFRETGYPLEVKATFACSDESLMPLWDISINTLKRCMHETYEDCPYYEQMQYIMDTRLQALFTFQLSADDRLARKAIFDFHSSLMPDGMIQSRYPSVYPQVIPGFSVYWIMMIADHYRYFGDLALVRKYLPTVDAILGWFEAQLNEDGLVGKLPGQVWSFVDWVEEWRHNQGVPIANESGPLTVYSLLYASALQVAAELNAHTGRSSTAEEYRSRAEAVKYAVRQHCWSDEEQLFEDGPGTKLFSQHAQIWAVLSGTAQGEEASLLIDRMLLHQSLPSVSYAMSFFLFRSLEKTGKYDRSFEHWDTWRRLAAQGLTTWVEDPVSQRSDCHGWGAVPIYEFTSHILGVQPEDSGYRRILIKPSTGNLAWAKGTVATPVGEVRVAWRITQDGSLDVSLRSPEGIPVRIELPDGSLYESVAGGEWHTPNGRFLMCKH